MLPDDTIISQMACLALEAEIPKPAPVSDYGTLPITTIPTTSEISPQCPATPPPPPEDIAPIPLRYPDTLNALIEIRHSDTKGLGVFALYDIPPGTLILSEAPLLVLQDTGSRIDPLDIAVKSLSPQRRKAFRSLHSFSRNKSESRNRSIVYSNGYSIMDDLATGVFETASRINHSCVPNLSYEWKGEFGRMVWWNLREIREGEEVSVSYGHEKRLLERIYGFVCRCEKCEGDKMVGMSGKERVNEERSVQ